MTAAAAGRAHSLWASCQRGLSLPGRSWRCTAAPSLPIQQPTVSSPVPPAPACPATPASPLQILQQAVCPERRRGFDGALSALASVTEVQISNDLQVAKVYLSIYR